MKFKSATIKSVRADINKKEITVSFVIGLEQLEEAEELTNYMGEGASDVNVTIDPLQPKLFNPS